MTETASERVGPIIFSDETARAKLCTAGRVVTFRRNRRTVGETWWRASRTGPKRGDVTVAELHSVSPNTRALRPYQEESGFGSVSAWKRAIEDVNDTLPAVGYLYRVTECLDEGRTIDREQREELNS